MDIMQQTGVILSLHMYRCRNMSELNNTKILSVQANMYKLLRSTWFLSSEHNDFYVAFFGALLPRMMSAS